MVLHRVVLPVAVATVDHEFAPMAIFLAIEGAPGSRGLVVAALRGVELHAVSCVPRHLPLLVGGALGALGRTLAVAGLSKPVLCLEVLELIQQLLVGGEQLREAPRGVGPSTLFPLWEEFLVCQRKLLAESPVGVI